MTESIMKEGEEREEIKKDEPRKRIFSPEMCSYTNEDNTGYVIEVVLPGVEKDTIHLKMTNEDIFVTGESDAIRYVGSYGLCCPVDTNKARARYNNGLLRIEAPFEDIDLKTVEVDIE
jgi:HSP20 family molecular chaperone IbpA